MYTVLSMKKEKKKIHQEQAEILNSISRLNFYKINEYKSTNIPLTVTNLADCFNEAYKNVK